MITLALAQNLAQNQIRQERSKRRSLEKQRWQSFQYPPLPTTQQPREQTLGPEGFLRVQEGHSLHS
jgi:hypothetical protein